MSNDVVVILALCCLRWALITIVVDLGAHNRGLSAVLEGGGAALAMHKKVNKRPGCQFSFHSGAVKLHTSKCSYADGCFCITMCPHYPKLQTW